MIEEVIDIEKYLKDRVKKGIREHNIRCYNCRKYISAGFFVYLPSGFVYICGNCYRKITGQVPPIPLIRNHVTLNIAFGRYNNVGRRK